MELDELQAMWQQYDHRLTENIRLNKEILKKMLKARPERRINWVTLQTGASLLLTPFILLIIFSFSEIKLNIGIHLFLGIFMFGGCCLVGYFWSVKHFLLLRKINFINPVTTTRKDINQFEKCNTKSLKMGYSLMPFGIIGVFLMFDMHFPTPVSLYALTPLLLCFVVMIVSLYFRLKWKNWWFKKLNAELDEIEELEKE